MKRRNFCKATLGTAAAGILLPMHHALAAALMKVDGDVDALTANGMQVYVAPMDFVTASALELESWTQAQLIENDSDFVMYLLDSAGVALVQGEAYGFSPYFRASFVAPDADIKRGGERMAQACSALL